MAYCVAAAVLDLKGSEYEDEEKEEILLPMLMQRTGRNQHCTTRSEMNQTEPKNLFPNKWEKRRRCRVMVPLDRVWLLSQSRSVEKITERKACHGAPRPGR